MINFAYIDAHTHLSQRAIMPFRETILSWINNGNSALTCSISEDQWGDTIKLARHRGITGAIGIHPWESGGADYSGWIQRLDTTLNHNPQLLVGECGVDTQLCTIDLLTQCHLFEEQLKLACAYNRAIIIHWLTSWDTLFEIVDRIGIPGNGALIHSFGGSAEIAQRLVNLGAMISFNGSLLDDSRKNIQRVIKGMPNTSFLLETDSPDQRSSLIKDTLKINLPRNIEILYKKVAHLRRVSIYELQTSLSGNYKRFIGA